MKLKKLLKNIDLEEIKGSKEVEITGVCSNSKLVAPGYLFIAKKGATVDGSQFIPEAIKAGAKAILTDIYNPHPTCKNVTQLIKQDVQSLEAAIAAQFHQYPSDKLLVVGITGTNGKTTTAYLIKHLMSGFQKPFGLIGTIEYVVGEQIYPATHTTPDISTNQKLLREMVNAGCFGAIFEVTSHALVQNRVAGIDFDVAIFTNLSQEHLDYHGTMEDYAKAKAKLFTTLNHHRRKKKFPVAAIVNADDPYSQWMLRECQVPVMTYGIDQKADIKASQIEFSKQGTQFVLQYQNRSYYVKTPLIGKYNVYNCLASLSFGISQHFPIEKMLSATKTFHHVPARLEPIKNALNLNIFVDFAHTPHALENALKSLQEFNKGRMITVFGCGGNRDKTKRPLMAMVCEKYSDICIATSDNPRSEDPFAILQQISQGFTKSYLAEVDRHKAILLAMTMAGPKDTVLIAGRGHERHQLFAHHTVEFDDRNVVVEIALNLSSKG